MHAQYLVSHALRLPVAPAACIEDMSVSELWHHVAFLRLQRGNS